MSTIDLAAPLDQLRELQIVGDLAVVLTFKEPAAARRFHNAVAEHQLAKAARPLGEASRA